MMGVSEVFVCSSNETKKYDSKAKPHHRLNTCFSKDKKHKNKRRAEW